MPTEKPLPHPMMDEYSLPEPQKESLAQALQQLRAADKVKKRFGPQPLAIEEHLDGHALGAIIAKGLPAEMIQALHKLYAGEGPPILLLHNFPIPAQSGETGKDGLPPPNKEAEYILEGMSFIMSDQPGKPHAYPRNLFHEQVKGSESLPYHSDSGHASPYLDGFACVVEGGKNITTDFRKIAYASLPPEQVPPEAEIKVLTKNGDILLFRDNELEHARTNPEQPLQPKTVSSFVKTLLHRPKETGGDPRIIQRLEMGPFIEGEPPQGWTEKLQARAKDLMTPPGRS
jgi:hypothetical protein